MTDIEFADACVKLRRIAMALGAPAEMCEPGMILFQPVGRGWLLYAGSWSSDVIPINAATRPAAINLALALSEATK